MYADTMARAPTQGSFSEIGVGESSASSLAIKSVGSTTASRSSLDAEMKLLHWHKLANEAALKAALIRNKKLKAAKVPVPPPQAPTAHMAPEERMAWAQEVMQREQTAPLQVSRDFVMEYERAEKEEDERLNREVQGHIASLQRLRSLIEQRSAMRSRHTEYSRIQKELEEEKKYLQRGRIAPRTPQTTQAQGGGGGGGGVRNGSLPSISPSPAANPQSGGDALHTVLGSLDKLIQLEKRISNLEHQTPLETTGEVRQKLPTPAARTQRGASRPMRLSFSKSRTTATLREPARQVYTVRPRAAPQRQVARRTASLRQRSAYSTASSRFPSVSRSQTFTSMSSSGVRRKASSSLSATDGRLRRRGRAAAASNKRPSEGTFMTSLPGTMYRRTNVQSRTLGSVSRSSRTSTASSRGIARAGPRGGTNNKRASQRGENTEQLSQSLNFHAGYRDTHKQAFHELRSEYTRRREALHKQLAGSSNSSSSRRVGTFTSRTLSSSRNAAQVSSLSSSRITATGGASGGGRTSSSTFTSLRSSRLNSRPAQAVTQSLTSGWGVRGLGVSAYSSARGSGAAAARARRR